MTVDGLVDWRTGVPLWGELAEAELLICGQRFFGKMTARCCLREPYGQRRNKRLDVVRC